MLKTKPRIAPRLQSRLGARASKNGLNGLFRRVRFVRIERILVLADLQSASAEYKHLKCEQGSYCGIANPYTQYGRIANPPEQAAAIREIRIKSLLLMPIREIREIRG